MPVVNGSTSVTAWLKQAVRQAYGSWHLSCAWLRIYTSMSSPDTCQHHEAILSGASVHYSLLGGLLAKHPIRFSTPPEQHERISTFLQERHPAGRDGPDAREGTSPRPMNTQQTPPLLLLQTPQRHTAGNHAAPSLLPSACHEHNLASHPPAAASATFRRLPVAATQTSTLVALSAHLPQALRPARHPSAKTGVQPAMSAPS